MVTNRHPLAIFAGSTTRQLGQEIANLLGVELGRSTTTRLADSEIHVEIDEVVRDKDVFFVQSCSAPVNDSLIELLFYLDAFRRASANSVSAVVPYFPYARQERMARGRESISARVVADAIEQSGARRVIYVDIHNSAIQGFFRIPADPLSAIPILCAPLAAPEYANAAIVSPDVGRAKMAGQYATKLGLPLVIMHKRRQSFTKATASHLVGDIRGLRPIVIDDLIAGGSILDELDMLYDAGAQGQAAYAITHPVMLPSAIQRIMSDDRIGRVYVSNTLPLAATQCCPKIVALSVAPLIAEVIGRIHTGESISNRIVLA
ncbi:MAG TPA: ribose-phosphate diphosphokinase [Anaerolineales bacterium]|nr:ribose-phosphate diphosphokinase [Anaerolineales bacterium]HRF47102.1 ribose-phosphate diphosphokinase [Anaerolineales bacterium]